LFRDASLGPLVRRALAGETPETVELPHTTPGADRPIWLEARCVPWRDAEGQVAGAAAFFTDVSDPQRRALLLHAMEAIGQSLTSSLDLNEVLDTIVGKALEVMGAESAMVVLGDTASTEFRVMRAAGRLSQQYAGGGTIPIGGGPISVAVREGRTVATRNLLTDPRLWLEPRAAPTSSARASRPPRRPRSPRRIGSSARWSSTTGPSVPLEARRSPRSSSWPSRQPSRSGTRRSTRPSTTRPPAYGR